MSEAAGGGTVVVMPGTRLDSPRLETARLVLRPLAPGDVPELVRHLCDLAVTRWLMRVPHPFTAADAENFLHHVELAAIHRTAVTWAITLARPGRPSGDGRLCGVIAVHTLDAEAEFGYWLARAEWGRGLMGEAAGAVLDWIDGTIAPERLHSGAFVGNAASLAIQRRYGFKVTGRSMRPCVAAGRSLEHVDTLLLRADYRALAAARSKADNGIEGR